MRTCLLCGHEHETTGCPQVYSANDYQSLQALYIHQLRRITALESDNQRLREALKGLLREVPRSVECQDMNHAKPDWHNGDQECKPLTRYRQAIDAAEASLAHKEDA